MSTPLVELRSVTKRYGTHPALASVSFQLAAGEAVGYLGPNGAGKTTTLRLIAGLGRPDEGEVLVRGSEPTRDPKVLARVGVLVETPGLLPYVTGRDLLNYIGAAKGLRPDDRASELRRWSERLGIAGTLERPVGGLSTGQARRLLLAGALLGDPDLLLLDEPTLGLDPAARMDLRTLLRGLRNDGRTLLLSTHLLEDVRGVCDRVLFLREGRLADDQPVDLTPRTSDGQRLRRIRLGFLAPADLDQIQRSLRSGEEVRSEGSTGATVQLVDEDARQREFVADLVRAALPLVSVEPAGSDLDARYLAVVGREEGSP